MKIQYLFKYRSPQPQHHSTTNMNTSMKRNYNGEAKDFDCQIDVNIKATVGKFHNYILIHIREFNNGYPGEGVCFHPAQFRGLMTLLHQGKCYYFHCLIVIMIKINFVYVYRMHGYRWNALTIVIIIMIVLHKLQTEADCLFIIIFTKTN